LKNFPKRIYVDSLASWRGLVCRALHAPCGLLRRDRLRARPRMVVFRFAVATRLPAPGDGQAGKAY